MNRTFNRIAAAALAAVLLCSGVFDASAQTTGGALVKGRNLDDLPNKTQARINLGVAGVNGEVSALDTLSAAQRTDVTAGTGAVNVATQVQAAITAAPNGTIFSFPLGAYLLSTAVTVTGKTDFRIRCAPGTRLI